jgi:hypothetical protein
MDDSPSFLQSQFFDHTPSGARSNLSPLAITSRDAPTSAAITPYATEEGIFSAEKEPELTAIRLRAAPD